MTAINQPSIVKKDFLAGFKDQLPLIVGVIPFGLVFGAYAISAGISTIETVSLSVLINAGSSQIAAIGLLTNGADPLIIIFSIALINLRFMLYSATWSGWMQGIRKPWKILLSYWLTDATFVLVVNRYRYHASPENLWYALGVGFGQWSAWIGSCVVGALLGTIVPASLSLEFALPLLFISLIMGHLINLPMVVAALVSGSVALLFINLPNNLGLLLSILVGILVGLRVEQWDTKRKNRLPL